MTGEPVEDRLRAAFADAEPSEESVAAARRAAVAAAVASAASRGRGRPRRRVLALAAAAVVIVGAGAATATVVMKDSGGPAIPATPEGAAGIRESGVLARAPWLFQSEGGAAIQTVPLRPALRFPPGTSYGEALTSLLRSVAADGTLPDEAVVVGHLARGGVWARGGRAGPRLDLTAPASYSVPEGRILPPDWGVSGDVSAKEALRIAKRVRDGLPLGEDAVKVRITIPALKACQRLPRARACRLDPPPRRRS